MNRLTEKKFKILVLNLIICLIFISTFLFSQNNQPKPVSEKEVAERIQILNKQTPINLVYNSDVQAYIDVYTVKRREHLAKIIGLAEYYFPIFEEYLAKAGLPLELKYLAIVESALDANAKSTSGAMGLWQFMFNASRMFNLQINSYVDERCDPIKSTEAATRYLKYLYDNFHNWDLALAAYNGGIATVNDAIVKSNGKRDFWEIKRFITSEMRGYVPAFIAVNYVMNYYETYGIEPIKLKIVYDDVESVELDKSVSFKQLENLLDISVEELRFLNPAYFMNFVPVLSNPVKIVIPKDKKSLYNEKLHSIKEELGPATVALPAFGDTRGRVKITHTVSKGEFFHKIAMDYGCRIEDIQKWNNLKKRDLMAGQKLLIWKRIDENPYFFICQEYNLFIS